MKGLIYRWRAYSYEDVCEAMLKLGYELVTEDYMLENYDDDEVFEEYLAVKLAGEQIDFVFSFNYFAVITKACQRADVPYMIWTCDSPLISMYNKNIFDSHNYIFTFDKSNCLEFQAMGVSHIWYLPLAVNAGKWQYVIEECDDLRAYQNDISFVGSLYERNSYDSLKAGLPEYLRGYFDAAMWAQQCISGGNILEEMLTVPILEQLQEHFVLEKSQDSFSNLELIFSTTVLGFKTAELQRRRALTELSKKYSVTVYSNSDTSDLLRVRYGGSLDYESQMPKVFYGSKINLNYTIPNIKTGLPLRIWDVLGCGGFLMTNFQAEIPYYFTNKRELVCFETVDELVELCGYYLVHEEERIEIAKAGYECVKEKHDWQVRIKEMMEKVFPSKNIL